MKFIWTSPFIVMNLLPLSFSNIIGVIIIIIMEMIIVIQVFIITIMMININMMLYMWNYIDQVGFKKILIRVSQFTLMSKIKWSRCVFPLVRALGPPKKNFGSFRAVLAVAQEIEYFQFSKGGPLVTQKKNCHRYRQYGYQKLCLGLTKWEMKRKIQ